MTPLVLPEIIGVKLTNSLRAGVNATDLVLTVTKILREKGVVGKFVEFFGTRVDNLSLPNRAIISNMCPEFGATCAYFPIDQEIIKHLTLTGRKSEDIELVEKYAKKQLLWRNTNDEIIIIVVMFKLSHYHIL
ncbi:aconitase family protein [Orientia tsutsugamushi str. Kato PP]|uniref:aconitate hydratase n=2 Tax=Orientia tsutsugamushi TaxID=784 RepID=B3CRP5_ORITI|nr:aconitase family protein [Orientia tsutsugamushi str. Kato PP]BAG40186.1 aconitate hydratase [Orientia tsutsugamushi str. Ikeda]SPR08821.1 Aconitate hydratase A [Orientia tsutsugamushi]